MQHNKKYAGKGHITLPYIADDDLIDKTIDDFME